MSTDSLPTAGTPTDDDLAVDLACPGCNADLTDATLYAQFRVCPECSRHFWIPARERVTLLVDPGSFSETNGDSLALDATRMHDVLPVADRLAEQRELPAMHEAVVTGTAKLGGEPLVVAAVDLAVLGASLGIVAGEKIAAAMAMAANRRLPFFAICSGGSTTQPEGVLALAQVQKLAHASARLQRARVPSISLLTHPTIGTALIGLGLQADLVFAEPGTHLGLAGGRGSVTISAEQYAELGEIDGILARDQQRDDLSLLLQLLRQPGTLHPEPLHDRQSPQLAIWEEHDILRHPQRPAAADYLHAIAPESLWLDGDRGGGDDPRTQIGIGRVGGIATALLGIGSRRDGAMAPLVPGAFRKARRLLALASQLELPVLVIIDDVDGRTVAASGEGDVARYLRATATAPVPIVVVATGEVAGPAGFALLSGDRLLMQRHAALVPLGSDQPALARDCERLGLADVIVPEPDAGAHADLSLAAHDIELHVASAFADLTPLGPRRLLEDRARRSSSIGLGTPAGREAARLELTELQDVQRRVRDSLDDLRKRIERRQFELGQLSAERLPTINLPRVNLRRESLGELASRVAASGRARIGRDAHPSEIPPGGETDS